MGRMEEKMMYETKNYLLHEGGKETEAMYQKLGKIYGIPCQYTDCSIAGKSHRIADYMEKHSNGFCKDCADRNPRRTPAECWKKYLELRSIDKRREQ